MVKPVGKERNTRITRTGTAMTSPSTNPLVIADLPRAVAIRSVPRLINRMDERQSVGASTCFASIGSLRGLGS